MSLFHISDSLQRGNLARHADLILHATKVIDTFKQVKAQGTIS